MVAVRKQDGSILPVDAQFPIDGERCKASIDAAVHRIRLALKAATLLDWFFPHGRNRCGIYVDIMQRTLLYTGEGDASPFDPSHLLAFGDGMVIDFSVPGGEARPATERDMLTKNSHMPCAKYGSCLIR